MGGQMRGGANGFAYIYTHRVRKKSLQYFMRNFNKLKYIFIIYDTNNPETPLY